MLRLTDFSRRPQACRWRKIFVHRNVLFFKFFACAEYFVFCFEIGKFYDNGAMSTWAKCSQTVSPLNVVCGWQINYACQNFSDAGLRFVPSFFAVGYGMKQEVIAARPVILFVKT